MEGLMADYREISQDYAQGAIKATFTLNGGASIAILSQVSKLTGSISSVLLGVVLLLWCFGVALSATTWGLGFYSTRYVDKSERESNVADNLDISNKYMAWSLRCIFASITVFLIGAIILAFALMW
jgi:hypothetical protein